MTTSIQDVIAAFGRPRPPERITQKTFDFDDDTSHLRRLCRAGSPPDETDLLIYVEDLVYVDIQPDLLAYLLPICLSAWQKNLMGAGGSQISSFAEYFWTALSRRRGFRDILSPGQARAVAAFMSGVILEKIDEERGLSFAGCGASAYSWIGALTALGTVFPAIPDLWTAWWSVSTTGRAYAVIQYASLLMYGKDDNPVFAPYTPDRGGGPPGLWHLSGQISDECWLPENVAFLREALTVDSVRTALAAAADVLRGEADGEMAELIASDIDTTAPLVEHVIRALPVILSSPLGRCSPW